MTHLIDAQAGRARKWKEPDLIGKVAIGLAGVAFAFASVLVPNEPAAAAQTVELVIPQVRYVSQLAEPAPSHWRGRVPTPYCVAASSLAVLESFRFAGPPNPIQTLYNIGQQGNLSQGGDGIDPNGASHLMKYFGGTGGVHAYSSQATAVTELVGRLNMGVPVVIFSMAGFHAAVVYGYQAVAGGGPLTGIYAQDPLTGFRGLVPIGEFTDKYQWWGRPFAYGGSRWGGKFIFVTYRELPGGPQPAGAVSFHSSWVSQSPYPTLAMGGTTTLSVTVRNTGTATWAKGTRNEAHLGVVGDDKTLTRLGVARNWFYADRPARQTEESVPPGANATFTFEVNGVAAGTHRLRLRPVIDGITWLEDQGIYLEITVK